MNPSLQILPDQFARQRVDIHAALAQNRKPMEGAT
jgi:hypothetical protein